MKADFTRHTFAPSKRYTDVLMQQGRVQLDADWNEQQAIHRYLAELRALDVTGPSGAPAQDAGFGLTFQQGVLRIGAGRYYVDGVVLENPAEVRYDMQDDLPGAPGIDAALQAANAQVGLVYLDVWSRHVDALEDPDLKEKALGGPDTTTRLKTIWQVRVLPCPGEVLSAEALRDHIRRGAELGSAAWASLVAPANPGRMAASTQPLQGGAEGLCHLPPRAGFLGAVNQLYRVEVHQGGTLAQSTFKWSRENGSVATRMLPLPAGGQEVELEDLGRDERLGFRAGDLVEVLTRDQRRRGEAGLLVRILEIRDRARRLVRLSANIPASGEARRVIRWDMPGNGVAALPAAGGPHGLELGVNVTFTGDRFAPGDFWLIPARVGNQASGSELLWPPPGETNTNQLALGVRHRRAPLAVVRRSNAGLSLEDLRPLFPPLVDIAASDVRFDDGQCHLFPPQTVRPTVQEAIEALCARTGQGGCSVVVKPGDDVAAVFAGIPAGADVRVCFQAGRYVVPSTVVVSGKGHLILSGVGAGTVLVNERHEAVLRFSGNRSVRLQDMAVEAQDVALGGRRPRLGGAVSVEGGGEVELERVNLTCEGSSRHSASCLSVHGDGATTVRVRGCRISVGHYQGGVLITDVSRVVVEDNEIALAPNQTRYTDLAVLGRDRGFRRELERMLVYRPKMGSTPIASRGGAPAEVSSGGVRLAFETGGGIAGLWPALVAANPLANPRGGQVALWRHIQRLASDVMLGRVAIPAGWAAAVDTWVGSLRRAVDLVAGAQGIVIAGRAAESVHIVRNRISGVREGIKVAVSHRAPAGAQPDQAGRVVIEANEVALRVTPALRGERFGIFIGNTRSLTVRDNHVQVWRQLMSQSNRVEGVRVFGVQGPFVQVQNNHLQDATVGVFMQVENATAYSRPQWRISQNFAAGAQETVTVRPDAARSRTFDLTSNST